MTTLHLPLENIQMQKCALVSLSDKTNIDLIGRAMERNHFVAISTGGTAKALRTIEGLKVMEVSDYTGFQEMLDGRVKTLHPKVHAALLARRDLPEHMRTLAEHGIEVISLVVVNLYQLEKKLAEPGATKDAILEETDIGGPAMLRSAAKGERIVVCDPSDYPRVIEALDQGMIDEDLVRELRAKVFTHTAKYDLLSARYHSNGDTDGFIGTKALACKYGENAWQNPAALYSTGTDDPLALDRFKLVAGQPPSYNNLCDLDRLLQTASHVVAAFPNHMRVAVGTKHGNACGSATGIGWSEVETIQLMVEGDPRSLFGGLVLTNFPIDVEDADMLLCHEVKSGKRILDGVIAPSFTEGAIELLRRKGDRCRFLANPALENLTLDRSRRFRHVRGGFLAQPNYTHVPDWDTLGFSPEVNVDLRLAWAVGATSNSNTITLVKNGTLIGNGVGQQDRVSCCELAIKRARDAGHDVKGAVAYSDSFFPFPDGPMALAEAGVRAIFATSGSVKDNEVRDACEKAGVRLYLLPDTEARGFFGH